MQFTAMCFCDGCDFMVTNRSTGEKHFIRGDEPLYNFFERLYSLPLLFHRLLKKEYVQLNGVFYAISRNSHPECERVRINLEKVDGVEKFELFGKCPNKYRHFLPSQRQ